MARPFCDRVAWAVILFVLEVSCPFWLVRSRIAICSWRGPCGEEVGVTSGSQQGETEDPIPMVGTGLDSSTEYMSLEVNPYLL